MNKKAELARYWFKLCTYTLCYLLIISVIVLIAGNKFLVVGNVIKFFLLSLTLCFPITNLYTAAKYSYLFGQWKLVSYKQSKLAFFYWGLISLLGAIFFLFLALGIYLHVPVTTKT